MNRHEQYEGIRHAPSNLLHMKSKPVRFDKPGAWPTHVNFQPWPQTPAPLGAGSLHECSKKNPPHAVHISIAEIKAGLL
jgi:hypothetical protein